MLQDRSTESRLRRTLPRPVYESSFWISKEVYETRGVVVNFDLGERFPIPRSQQRGSLRPRARRVAVLWMGAEGVDIFLRFFYAKSRVWGNFGQKIN